MARQLRETARERLALALFLFQWQLIEEQGMKKAIFLKSLLLAAAVISGIFLGNTLHSAVKGKTSSVEGSDRINFPNVKAGVIVDSTNPGILDADAQANISKKLVAETVVWRLTVRDAITREVLMRRVYRNQAFKLRVGIEVSRKFRERIDAPPGLYMVTVGLVRPNARLMPDGSVADHGLCASTFYENVR